VPWRESHTVSERMKFVVRLNAGESMSDLCREFGISRKTGYKFWERYKQEGPGGLEDASRAPKRVARRTAAEIEQALVDARNRHPTWGGRKLKRAIEREQPGLIIPSASTVSGILKRHGLTKPRRRWQRPTPWRSPLTAPQAANEVWAVDYKGQFRLGTGEYCYPLTATDVHSRFLLAVEALESTDEESAREVFRGLFQERGLPEIIRSDNGTPFASCGLAGLTSLSAWWLRLGIRHERTEPAHPEQNGQHERMHRTLKAETTRPAGRNVLEQQERFDTFRQVFNEERPHEALGLKTPAEVYQPSPRHYPAPLPELRYPLHDDVLLVTKHGHIRLPKGRTVFLSNALADQPVGLREGDDGRWLVTFVNLDLGTYDPRAGSFEPLNKETNTPST
jgi:transposase InsO family protein